MSSPYANYIMRHVEGAVVLEWNTPGNVEKKIGWREIRRVVPSNIRFSDEWLDAHPDVAQSLRAIAEEAHFVRRDSGRPCYYVRRWRVKSRVYAIIDTVRKELAEYEEIRGVGLT